MILRPQYTQRPVEILLIGPANSGKRTLAKQLIKCRETYFTTSTMEKLLLEHLEHLKSCDYVLLMVDLINRLSLTTLREVLSRIDSQYLVDRCAVVVTKVDAPMAWMIEDQEIQDVIDSYAPDIYVFRANLTDEDDCQLLCDRIARIVRTSALQQKGVTTALVKSAVYYNQIPFSARSVEVTPYNEEGSLSRISAGSDKGDHEEARDAAEDSQQDAEDAVEDAREESPAEGSARGDGTEDNGVQDEDARDSALSDVAGEEDEQQTAQ